MKSLSGKTDLKGHDDVTASASKNPGGHDDVIASASKTKRAERSGKASTRSRTKSIGTQDASQAWSGTAAKLQHFRESQDAKVVGLKKYGLSKSTRNQRFQLDPSEETVRPPPPALAGDVVDPNNMNINNNYTLEEKEEQVRIKAQRGPFYLLLFGNLAALRVFGFYLITLETLITVCASVGLTLYWYCEYKDDPDWNGGSLDFILLAFAIITPISSAIQMAFNRRERALIAISNFRSFSYHIYLAHCVWDWEENGGRSEMADRCGVDWLKHCDGVMSQLVGIGDELSRFLTLPSASRSRHRMTKSGRREAGRTMEVAYQLLESTTTQRLTRLQLYSEKLKKLGLSVGEVSRIRQYERFLSDSIEQLRMVKLYRTPQALRSFGRIFTVCLPPFYAPNYAQVAIDVNSLGMGVAFAIITALGLTALFESLQVLEDPFTAFLTLDGIDVREEFVVLNFAQLLRTRSLFFPAAPTYPPMRRSALVGANVLPGTESLFSLQSATRVPQQPPPPPTPPPRRDVPLEKVEVDEPAFGQDSREYSAVSLVGLSLAGEDEPNPHMDDEEDAATVRESSYAIPESSNH